MKVARVPLRKVCRRLGLSLGLLTRILNSADEGNNPLPDKRARAVRFSKIHDRARELIDSTLKQSKTPITLRHLQQLLVHHCRLRVSRTYIGQYLRTVKKCSYRMLKPIMPIHNELRCKL